jgi:5'-nucleotidase
MRTSTPETPTTRRRGVIVGAALATAGVLVALSTPTAAVAADPVAATIDLYDVNDFHGRLEAASATPKAGDVAGAAVLSGAVKQLRAQNPNSAFVSAGDNIGASTFTSFVQRDQPTIDALNEAGLSVSAIGNHELDGGQDDLRNRIIGPDGARNAQFDYVSSNIVRTSDGTPAFAPYSVKTIGGVRVGFIGATTELIPELVSPAGIAGLRMADLVDSVNTYADRLTDGVEANGEADALVLLVHEGAADATLATSTETSDFGHIAKDVSPKVSVIFSAHTHQLYDHDIVPTGGTTPRPVLQTGSYGTYLGHARLTIDPLTKRVAAATADYLPLAGSGFPVDPVVAKTVSDAVAVAKVEGSKKLGTIDTDMRRAVQSNGSENRGGESTLGNFVAEVQRSATERSGAQIAFMNPGGLRADMTFAASGTEGDGVVTYQEAAAVQPFANTLVVLDLTGAQISQALEQQWQPAGAGRPFLKLGASKGFAYTYDPLAAAGSHVTAMTLDGATVDPARTYKVTVNSFLASGGDNFTAFNGAAAKADSGQVDLQAQVDYFTRNPKVTVAADQRAVGVHATATPAGGFQAGDAVTVDLSSVTFSSVPDQTGTVTLHAGHVELGSGQVDASIVDTTDEQGRTSIDFTVPAADDSTASPAVATPAAATRLEPVVATLPDGQQVVLPLAVPVPVAEPVEPGTDPVDGTDPGTDPVDGTDPGTAPVGGTAPGQGTALLPVAGGTGGTPSASAGSLAYTGADLTFPASAALLLLLSGTAAWVVARRKRAAQMVTGTSED